MTLDAAQIDERLKQALPHATITIDDLRGDGLYLAIAVSDPSFAGLSRVDQHRIVYKAIGPDIIDPPPSLSIRTTVPQ
jgi:stress-induced morphogen